MVMSLSLSLKNGIIFGLVIVIAHVSLTRMLAQEGARTSTAPDLASAARAPPPSHKRVTFDTSIVDAKEDDESDSEEGNMAIKIDAASKAISSSADTELQKYVFGTEATDEPINASRQFKKPAVEAYTGTLSDATADTNGRMLLQNDRTSRDGDLPGFEDSGMFTMLA
jgi:hypothetical protein